jgi:hypothetical protein
MPEPVLAELALKPALGIAKLALEPGLGLVSKPEPVVNALRFPTSLAAIAK